MYYDKIKKMKRNILSSKFAIIKHTYTSNVLCIEWIRFIIIYNK